MLNYTNMHGITITMYYHAGAVEIVKMADNIRGT